MSAYDCRCTLSEKCGLATWYLARITEHRLRNPIRAKLFAMILFAHRKNTLGSQHEFFKDLTWMFYYPQ